MLPMREFSTKPVNATAKLLCWHLLHLLFTFITSFISLLSHLKSSVCSSSSSSSSSSHKIKKLPRHLALLVDSEDAVLHLSKLVALLEQLAHLGLQHISLYDVEGTLKCCLGDALRNNSTVQFYFHNIAGDEYLYQDVNCNHQEPCSEQKAAGGKHNTGSVCPSDRKGQLLVEVLCLRDGKQAIVEAARNICLTSLQSGAFSDLREEDIDTSLKETGSIGPDPDVLLLFSNSRCLQGFPPWRLRLTEIQHVGSIKDLTERTIFCALDEFSHKHHRYGK